MPTENLSATMQAIGSYDLLEKIAEGGMGTVYRGKHRETGVIVAIKVVPSHMLSNPVVLKRFEQEYNAARNINHPNIVKALDFGRDGETRYLVMEYVDGESLGQRIERDGRMEENDAIHIIAQVAEALQTAHQQGMIHRDVKPDNILLTSKGVAKLTDLGLVKELETDLNLTRTGRGLGTPHFMAPEQFRNAKKADARCDIYSLGATLYMMVTGYLPFQSNGPLDAWMKKINNEIDAPRKRAPSLSERTDRAIRRAIDPDPLLRPETCREFIDDLNGQNTREIVNTEVEINTESALWYLVYSDEAGLVHTVKGTSKGVRRSLREGLLGNADEVRIARSKSGPFELIKNVPDFADVLAEIARHVHAGTGGSSVIRKKAVSPSSEIKKTAPVTQMAISDSSILAQTSLSMPAVPMGAVKKAPRPKTPHSPSIQFKAREETWTGSVEWVKYLILALFFCMVGALATFFLPTVIRYIRFMQ